MNKISKKLNYFIFSLLPKIKPIQLKLPGLNQQKYESLENSILTKVKP